jgi:hypothetical protein
MKNFLIFLTLFFVSCEKDDDLNVGKYELSTVPSWITIDFKSEYTIQVPDGYEGIGMAGFEGNTFTKYSSDRSVFLTYGFCNSLFCYDFGDTLHKPLPLPLVIKDKQEDESIVLSKISKFYEGSILMGIFYYSNETLSEGRLYWKDNEQFKQALKVNFNQTNLDTVINIISTIKKK